MRLGDVLDAARSRTFVGRARELAAFHDALAGRSPRRVFLVHGVGGIGKSTLLGQFRADASAVGRTAVLIDGREVDPSPAGVRAALAHALHRAQLRLDDLRGLALLVDHYEQLTATDDWLRGNSCPSSRTTRWRCWPSGTRRIRRGGAYRAGPSSALASGWTA